MLGLAVVAVMAWLLRDRRSVTVAVIEDGDIVGMPTGVDWNRFFSTGYEVDPAWRN